MNTANIILLSILGVILLSVFLVMGSYNGLVNVDVSVENMWGKVQTAYQRRADLIPNLVETVKGARDFERDTLIQLTSLRSQAGQVQQQTQNANTIPEMQQVQEQTSSILSRLLVIVENYPDLKSNQNFLFLQDELAGTENRIKWERDNYNDAVKGYKVKVRRFPTNIMAGIFGFQVDKWDMFEAEQGAEEVVEVDFR